MDWVNDHLWQSWLILAGVLAAAELLSMDLVLLMLAAGAVVGALGALAGTGLVVSLLLALGASVATLALVRPSLLRRLHGGPDLRTGTDAMLGRQGTVLAELGVHTPGRVKLGGEEWRALPYDEGDRIEPGAVVEVVRIEGATAYVLRIPSIES